MVHQQLQAALALVFIYVQAIDELHGAFRWCEAVGLFNEIEGNGIECAARFGNFQPHFQVPVAHDARIANGKNAVKTGFRKCLPPRAPCTQRAGGV